MKIINKIKNPSKDALTIVWLIFGLAITIVSLIAGAAWFISAWFMDELINKGKN